MFKFRPNDVTDFFFTSKGHIEQFPEALHAKPLGPSEDSVLHVC